MTATPEQQVAALQARYLPDVQAWLRDALADPAPGSAPGPAPGINHLLRYHMGWEDAGGAPTPSEGGKALRPVLCLTACELAGGDWRRALPAAAALELVHNFSLVHDDIQDGDVLRRGRETLWSVWGIPAALSGGNAMRVTADRTLAKLEGSGVGAAAVMWASAELNQRYLEMIEGQYLDMAFEQRPQVTVADYLDMIGRKTGALFESAMFLGALVANADPDQARAFGACGRRMGIAFQVRDDYLGVWGDTAETLKPLTDIQRKKKSLPLVYLLEAAADEDRAWLARAYADDEVSGPNVRRILRLLDRLDARRYVTQTAEACASEARALAEALGLGESRARSLEAIAAYCVSRDR
ncbi:MAG: polyprenyl synthetase family protein [Chloroflexi bacterium]|nr:polyprenyl synthetase family protein [Chloroflexota bacterium]MCH7655104.1 polyprenyl synthetase family protein [Chloroflexota bacterium]